MSETLSVEKLQAEVNQVNIDLDLLKKESSDDIIKTKTTVLEAKVTTTKDNITKKIDELKALGEASHTAEIAKLENMLVLLNTSTSDFTDLKKDVTNNSSTTPEKKEDKKDDKTDEDKSWFTKQIDGFADSTEENHVLKNTARIAGGIGILAIGIRGVKKLFGIGKNKKEAATNTTDQTSTTDTPDATTSPTDTTDEKKTSFGSKVWKVLKYGGLAVGGFFGLKWLVGKEGGYKDVLDRLGIRNRAEAPAVTADDTVNTITGLAAGMEYSSDDGKTYTAYTTSKIPKFVGDQKVLVRIAKTDALPESKTKEVVFTKNTPTNTSNNTVPEQTTLTAEELTKRNTAITDSINKATAFPITIDYGIDKTALEAKGCPKTINFDATTQSIMFGDKQLKVNVGNFETQTSFGKATVNSVTINSISYTSDTFNLNVTGTGKLGFISKTDTQDVSLGKADILSLLQPYYIDKKTSYDVSITDADNNIIPVSIEKVGSDETNVNATTTEYDQEFLALDQWKQTQYTTLDSNVKTMYTETITSVTEKIKLPPLLVRNDESLSTGSSYASIMYMLDQNYGTMDKVLHDDYFSKIEQKTDLIVDDVVEFLKKYQDNEIIGGMFTTIASRLEGYLKQGGFDETSLKTKLKDDPNALAQLKVLIKKASIIRFFVSEKRKIYEKNLKQNDIDETGNTASILTDTFDGVRFVGESESDISLHSTLKDNNILDSELSIETEGGIALNKSALALQKKIENTEATLDYSGQRGKIRYDYASSKLKSRDNATEIEIISRDGLPIDKNLVRNVPEMFKPKGYTFRIKDLPISITSADQAVWLANFINKMLNTYGDNILQQLKNNVTKDPLERKNNGWVYVTDLFDPGIYVTQGFWEGLNPFDLPDQILEKGTLYDNCPGWGNDEAEALVAYLNKRFTKLAG